MSVFLAGASEINITPPSGVDLAGYFDRKGSASGINDDLKAAALVFDDRHQKSAICSLDVVGVKPEFVETVRQRVSYKTAIQPERIMIAATHTHSGPSLDCDNLLNQKWLRELEDKLVRVIMEADCYRRPAKAGSAVGEVTGIGANRRDPENGPVDNSVNVMKINDAETDKTIAVIVNYACHATTLGIDNLLVTADYPGNTREYIKTNHEDHPVVMFLNGACGDVNPGGYSAEDAALGKFIPNRTFEQAKNYGTIIGKEAIRLLKMIKTSASAKVMGKALKLKLPLKNMKFPAETLKEAKDAELKLKEISTTDAPVKEIDKARLELFYANIRNLQAKRLFMTANREIDTAVQGIVVNDTLFIGFPGELFSELGIEIKKASPFKNTFIVGYANDGAGYFPTKSALASDSGYEVLVSIFGNVAIDRLSGWTKLLAEEMYEQLRDINSDSESAKASVVPCLNVPEHHPKKAKFPAIDFHIHYNTLWQPMDTVLADMAESNVRYAVNMLGESFPQAEIEPVFKVYEKGGRHFFHFSGLDYRRIDDPDWSSYVEKKLQEDVKLGIKGIKIYKELGLSYRDAGGNLILPDDERLKPVWNTAAELKLPVLYHIADPLPAFGKIEPSNEYYDSLKASSKWWWGAPGFPSHEELIQAAFRLAEQNKNTNFIFPHCASLTHDLRRVTKFLSRNSNAYVDISARLNTLARQPYSARDFIMANPDKIIWGTDDMWPNRGEVYQHWFRFMETRDEYFSIDYYGGEVPWKLYGIYLPDDVLRKVYGLNAAKLLNIKL